MHSRQHHTFQSVSPFTIPCKRALSTPFGQRHVAINIYNICKGHLGSRGGASKNKLKDTIFIFPMTNVTILGVFYLFIYTIFQEGDIFSSTASLPYGPLNI